MQLIQRKQIIHIKVKKYFKCKMKSKKNTVERFYFGTKKIELHKVFSFKSS